MSQRWVAEQLVIVNTIADAVRALPLREIARAVETEDAAAPWMSKMFTAEDRRVIAALAHAQRELEPSAAVPEERPRLGPRTTEAP
jgi:hypothetical protein